MVMSGHPEERLPEYQEGIKRMACINEEAMTIDEAIERLVLMKKVFRTLAMPEQAALSLGIEALEELKHLRKTRISKFHKLPSEISARLKLP